MKKEHFIIILFSMYLLPLAFDFKGEDDGGGVSQLILILITCLSFLLLLFFCSKQATVNNIPTSAKTSIKVWWAFLFFTILSAFINSVPLAQYFRVVLPFLLCGMSMVLVALLYSKGIRLSILFSCFFVSAIASVVWTPIYQVGIIGGDINLLRHQIVGPLLPLVFAFAFSYIFSSDGNKLKGVLLILFSLVVISVSVTRNYLLVPFSILLFFILFARRSFKSTIWLQLLGSAKYLIVFSFFAIPLVGYIKPGVFDFWSYRLFGLTDDFGFDPTTYTRLAEYTAQFNILVEDPLKFLTGAGMGSEYYWDSSYFSDLSQILPLWYLEDLRPWVAGHSSWVYSFYSAGLVFGCALPFVYFRSVIASCRLISANIVPPSKSFVFYNSVIFAYLPLTVIANPFGSRISSLVIGVFLILPLLYEQNRARNDE